MNKSKRALLVLAPGFEEIETVAPIDVLTRVGVEVVVAATQPGPIQAAYGTTLLPTTTLDELEGEFEAIICPGGKANAKSLAADERVIGLVREYFQAGKLVAAICAAPSHVLGESAGILRGRRATGDPGFIDKLEASGAIVEQGPVCIDGSLITATGPGSALSFALAVAANLVGEQQVRPFAEKWGVELFLE